MFNKRSDSKYLHGPQERIGILLINLGSPEHPTSRSVRKYLAEFLWDPRVIEFPRALWWLILHGVILRFRPSRSAKAYKKIWTDQGSPLVAISTKQAQAIEKQRPQGERHMTAAEWLMYNILELRFVKGLRVRDFAQRLAMIEADLYRKQRLAIEEVARTLREMETQGTANTSAAASTGTH